MKPVLLAAGLLSAVLCAVPAAAAIRTFPSVPPCNATLQACINASDPGDTILVASNGTINQSIALNKPLVLRAGVGYRPVFPDGFSITGSVNAAGNWLLQVEGFTLQRGMILLTAGGGDEARIVVRNNRIEAGPESGAAPIAVQISSAPTTELEYDVSYNHVDFAWDTHDGGVHAAINVFAGGGASGAVRGLVRDNRIDVPGNEATGIRVVNYDRPHRVAVSGNHVLSGVQEGIYLQQGGLFTDSTGTLTALVANNVVRSKLPGSRDSEGILVESNSGTVVADVLHNTVVDAWRGVRFEKMADQHLSGRIEGNLFAYLTSGAVWFYGGVGELPMADNLVFDVGSASGSQSWPASTVFADPLLRQPPADANLLPGSPAIDRVPAASLLAALDAFDVPHTDGNGLRRLKRRDGVAAPSQLDIGALEAGDASVVRRAPASAPGTQFALGIPEIDGSSSATPLVTQNWNPDNSPGIYNNHQQSTSHVSATGTWLLRQEDGVAFPPNAAFNVFAPAIGGRFTRTNTEFNVGGNTAQIDDGLLNNNEHAILLATRARGSTTPHDFTSPLGVTYFSGVWSLVAMDGSTMPPSGGFNLYTQPPSLHAFVHRVSPGNRIGNTTRIDHPSLNGRPCAVLHLTQGADGPLNVHHVGVYYDGAYWAIFNQDSAAMPDGVAFHVVIDAQAPACDPRVFADGFE